MQLVNIFDSILFLSSPLIVVPSSKVVCYKCGLNLFKQLAYEFRVRMKADEIHPIAFRQREDCHYGRNCRTQFNKLAHAQKFNHACDQTKF